MIDGFPNRNICGDVVRLTLPRDLPTTTAFIETGPGAELSPWVQLQRFPGAVLCRVSLPWRRLVHTVPTFKAAAIKLADEFGVAVQFGQRGKHPFAIFDRQGLTQKVHFPGSASDYRAIKNFRARVRRTLRSLVDAPLVVNGGRAADRAKFPHEFVSLVLALKAQQDSERKSAIARQAWQRKREASR